MGRISSFFRSRLQPARTALPSDAVWERARLESAQDAVKWMTGQLMEGETTDPSLAYVAREAASQSLYSLAKEHGEAEAIRIRSGVCELVRSTIRLQSEPDYIQKRRARSVEYGVTRVVGRDVVERSLEEFHLVAAPSGRLVPAGWLLRVQLHRYGATHAIVHQAAAEYIDQDADGGEVE